MEPQNCATLRKEARGGVGEEEEEEEKKGGVRIDQYRDSDSG
jgi:hypothetical protein